MFSYYYDAFVGSIFGGYNLLLLIVIVILLLYFFVDINFFKRFRDLTNTHKLIYLCGTLVLLIINTLALYSFQSSRIAEQILNQVPGMVTYSFMEDGQCVVLNARENDGYARAMLSKHLANSPCTGINFYLKGQGTILLLLSFLFLSLFPYVAKSFVDKSKVYKHAFWLSMILLLILIANVAIIIVVGMQSMGGGSSVGILNVEVLSLYLYGSPLIYFSFLWYGWGQHREHRRKLISITVLGLIPLVIYSLILIFG